MAISDGSFDYDPLSLFGTLEREEIIKRLDTYPLVEGKIRSPYTFLFVDTGKNKVLVDMGAGNLGQHTGKLIQNLQVAGIDPGDIDTVVITHAHPDHVGGTLNNKGEPNYPNAAFYISQKEFNFWFDDNAYQAVMEHLSAILSPEVFFEIARGQLGPIRHRIRFITQEKEVVPGVRVHDTPGHTPGHLAVSFASSGEQLWFVGDALVFPFMIGEPDTIPRFDIQPDIASKTRKKLRAKLTNDKTWVLAQHFPPFPSLGQVVRKGKSWTWEPRIIT
jgi:glyoxylase-like metal-dependent hydrolase (beta-lactamase superfamily II)